MIKTPFMEKQPLPRLKDKTDNRLMTQVRNYDPQLKGVVRLLRVICVQSISSINLFLMTLCIVWVALGKLSGPGSNIQPQALNIQPDSFLRVSTTEVQVMNLKFNNLFALCIALSLLK